MKLEPDLHSVPDVLGKLRKALRCKGRLHRIPKEQQKPIVWSGPKFTACEILAVCLNVDEQLSEEGLQHSADNNEDILDIVLKLAYQFGLENGLAIRDHAQSLRNLMRVPDEL